MLFELNSSKTNIEFVSAKTIEYPKVKFTTYVLMKMKAYIDEHDKEISWLGVVDKNENEYIVSDVMLFEQKVSGVTTDISEESLTAFGTKLIVEGKQDLFNKIRLWGHSHVNMSTFASGTDNSTFEQFYPNCDYFIRLIANKKGEMKLDLVDMNNNLKYENVPWEEIKTQEQIEIEQLMAIFNNNYTKQFNLIKDRAKNEIKLNIIENLPGDVKPVIYPTYKDYEDDYADNSPNGYWYKEQKRKEEEEKKRQLKEEEEKIEDVKFDILVKRYGSSTTKLFYVKLSSLFTMEQIVKVAEEGVYWTDLRELYREDLRFIHYSDEDWKELYDLIEDAYIEESYAISVKMQGGTTS